MNKETFKNQILNFDGTDTMKNHCINEVLNKDVYRVFDIDPSIIKNVIDVGANIGCFSYICSQLFTDANIYSIEPSPVNFQSLSKNTNGIQNIKIFQKAIHQKTNINITTTSHEGNTGRNQAFITKESEIPDCTSVNFLDFIKDISNHENTILKIDCEGCEKFIFDKIDELKNFYQLSFELHRRQGREYTNIVNKFLNEIGSTHNLIYTTRTERVYRKF
jgi:FkbM family methyltransferase